MDCLFLLQGWKDADSRMGGTEPRNGTDRQPANAVLVQVLHSPAGGHAQKRKLPSNQVTSSDEFVIEGECFYKLTRSLSCSLELQKSLPPSLSQLVAEAAKTYSFDLWRSMAGSFT